MKKIYLSLLLMVLTFNHLLSQKPVYTLENINNRINEIAKSKEEKVKAIYKFIANRIAYDASFNPRFTDRDTVPASKKIEQVLKTQKGGCTHYSLLFDTLCKMNEIPCFVVIGYNKDRMGTVGKIGHAWNIVEIKNRYQPVDVTWGAGFIYNGEFVKKYNEKYFLKRPKKFVKTHMPFDPIWQLSSNPITNYEFENEILSEFSKKGAFNYKDSIRHFMALDSYNKIIAQKRRLEKNGVINHLTSRQLRYYKGWIAYQKFDSVVNSYNKGIYLINEYWAWKRTFFKDPVKTDEEVKGRFRKAESILKVGFEDIKSFVVVTEEMKRVKEQFLTTQSPFMIQLEKESWFVDEYVSRKGKPRRFLWDKIY